MIQLVDITKTYTTGTFTQAALDHVSLDFRKSEFVAILGQSGSGKTTLLNIVGGLDHHDSGDLAIDGRSTKGFQDRDWDAYRNDSIGFVFQTYNLIMHQSALSNVEMALRISGESKVERKAKAMAVLKKVGLEDHMHKRPNMMSGGQMQRVAIARALVNDPDIILADEPTGALDSETSIQVMGLLKEIADDRLVIMVTHNPELAERYATRTVRLKDGTVVADSDPFDGGAVGESSKEAFLGRTRLKFGAALGLSANNLMTKKGRTILTSFAGAIGIIGIALILALSSGMNDYISSIERDTMGSYPIELEKETFDLNSMMSNGAMSGFGQSVTDEGGEVAESDGSIVSDNVVADSVTASESLFAQNNLGDFKAYLDANESSIDKNISAIEYGYGIEPQVFRIDETAGVIQVSPSTLSTDSGSSTNFSSDAGASMGSGMSGMMGSSGMSGMSNTSVNATWSQLPDNAALREKQYELKEGSWPEEHNEVAIVIDENNRISDFTLYTLGLKDWSELQDLISAVENEEDFDDPQVSFSYDDAIGLEFQVFAKSGLFKESDADEGTWIDKSEDGDHIESIFNEGTTVTITGVLRATGEAGVSSGVVYTGNLAQYLIETASTSTVVKQQQGNPDRNVLTGELFDPSQDEIGVDEVQSTEGSETAASGEVYFSAMDSGSAATSAMMQLSDDQIAVLIAQMSNDTPSTLEDVLSALGYADIDQPATIALYPTDFDGKAAIQGFIEEYNNQVDNDNDRVTYSDIVGTMTSSISSIVDIISSVLIAFVAISLVVSSIMIAIITYISVLERTKEIGILRAIGASKNDISKIFNAETIIEGIASGLIGVGVALLLCIPINAIISSMVGADGIASLPLEYSLVLIAISVLLNFVAGFIPSRMAAKKDPVEALRSE